MYKKYYIAFCVRIPLKAHNEQYFILTQLSWHNTIKKKKFCWEKCSRVIHQSIVYNKR